MQEVERWRQQYFDQKKVFVEDQQKAVRWFVGLSGGLYALLPKTVNGQQCWQEFLLLLLLAAVLSGALLELIYMAFHYLGAQGMLLMAKEAIFRTDQTTKEHIGALNEIGTNEQWAKRARKTYICLSVAMLASFFGAIFILAFFRVSTWMHGHPSP